MPSFPLYLVKAGVTALDTLLTDSARNPEFSTPASYIMLFLK
jgi:hypothetical protein